MTGYYELGTVLDGTFKKFPEEAKVYRTGRIKCGTESNGGYKNITISNCVFEGCQGLALESEDGALCEDITISNITMRDVIMAPFFFRLGARLRGPKESTKTGTLQRVMVSNCTSYNSDSRVCSIVSGIPGYAIKDVKFTNIYHQHKGGDYADLVKVVPPEEVAKYPDPGMFGPMPAQGFFLRHVENLEMSHVEIAAMRPDPRPAFHLQNGQRADFIAVTAMAGQKAFALNQVKDLRVLLSRAAADTTLAQADGQTL